MTFSTRSIAAAVLALTLGFSNSSKAAPVTFLFGGQVVGSSLSSAANPGDTVSGSFTFESTDTDSSPASPVFGDYLSSLSSFDVTAGSYTGSASGGSVHVLNNGTIFDSYTVESFTPVFSIGPSTGGFSPIRMTLQLVDPTGTAFSSDALPLTPPDLSSFVSNTFSFRFFNPSTSQFAGITAAIETLAAASGGVPAPAASMLLIAGLAALGLRRRRKA